LITLFVAGQSRNKGILTILCFSFCCPYKRGPVRKDVSFEKFSIKFCFVFFFSFGSGVMYTAGIISLVNVLGPFILLLFISLFLMFTWGKMKIVKTCIILAIFLF
jgi:hypothetical protein